MSYRELQTRQLIEGLQIGFYSLSFTMKQETTVGVASEVWKRTNRKDNWTITSTNHGEHESCRSKKVTQFYFTQSLPNQLKQEEKERRGLRDVQRKGRRKKGEKSKSKDMDGQVLTKEWKEVWRTDFYFDFLFFFYLQVFYIFDISYIAYR